MEVACGQCLGCRLDRARMWAVRIVHESSLHEFDGGNCFITLTYRDEADCTEKQRANGYFIPQDWSLCKKHFQDFMKRLRKARNGQKIRFFHVGEYGNICKHKFTIDDCQFCTVGRPHYHACLFNCSFDDLYAVGQHNGIIHYASDELERIWKFGFVQVGELNFQSAGYVARYVLKKVTGHNAEESYMNIDRDGSAVFVLPEYATMSRRPGIGKTWFDKYGTDVFPSDEIPVPGAGVFKKVPRYYDDLLAAKQPEVYLEIKNLREIFRREHFREYSSDRLADKHKVKKAQLNFLKRGLS